MWELNPANSPELIDRLRPHARRFTLEKTLVGEGWRPLVEECHERLRAAFPDYELLAVKQKWGALEFQAFPRRRAEGRTQWTQQEHADLKAITSQIRDRSEHVCEWCGAAGNHRESRTLELTLCDACDERFPDPPYPVHGPIGGGNGRSAMAETSSWQEFLDGAWVDDAVFSLCPDYRALLLAVDGIAPGPTDDQSEALLGRAEKAAAGLLADAPVEELPHIAAWREAYRLFGAKPQRTRNSLEALTRRAAAGLPRVNRLTDLYNAYAPQLVTLLATRGHLTTGSEVLPRSQPDHGSEPREAELARRGRPRPGRADRLHRTGAERAARPNGGPLQQAPPRPVSPTSGPASVR